ncbi:MAG: hypothetical protein EXS17_00515 [Phycisphaerales bacterium]|nr:hypothetical protein [Phycisphaerales bacterium]
MKNSPATRLREAFRWLETPAACDMGSAARRLRRASNDSRLQTSLLREVLLAKRLAATGFAVRSEVATSSGKSCDLVAKRGALRLHLHVKSVEADDALIVARSARVPRALQSLEQLTRRLLIEVEWTTGLSSDALQTTADAMRTFLLRASIGDECIVRSRRGTLRGRCRVRSPHDHAGVSLAGRIADDHIVAVARMRRLLRKARAQFLSGGENVIVLFGPKSAQWLFEEALLGTPVERWDAFPRRGERVAMGSGDDGFWHAGARDLSRIAVWRSLESFRDDSIAWIRPGVAVSTRAACDELFSNVREIAH